MTFPNDPHRASTHYDVLAVAIDATEQEIRVAYRRMAKAAHPDAGGHADEFRRILDAYETLVDATRRAAYDERIGVRRPSLRTGKVETGWTGRQGSFTGDVTFPDYLRDVAEAPWSPPDTSGRDTTSGTSGGGGTTTSSTSSRPGPGRAHDQVSTADRDTEPARVAWCFTEPSACRPVAADTAVLIEGTLCLIAVDRAGGRELWRGGLPAKLACAPVVHGSLAFAACTGGTLHCFDLDDGDERWQRQHGEIGPGEMVALVDGVLVVSRSDRRIVGLDPSTGRRRWESKVTEPASAKLAAGGGTVVAVTRGSVEALEIRKGRHRWRVSTREPVQLPAVVTGETVWVSSGNGVLHRLELATGAAAGVWQAGTAVAGLSGGGDLLFATADGPPQLVVIDPFGRLGLAVSTGGVCPAPAISWSTAYLAEPGGRITAIDIGTGSISASTKAPFEPLGPPVAAGDRLVLQDQDHRVWALVVPAA